jgi:hypothetical protein
MKTLFVVASLVLAVGCGHHAAVAPVRASVGEPGGVRVQLRQVSGNILKLVVFNDTGDMVVIDRDQVVVHTPHGDLNRVAGGMGSIYNVPAGGVHDLNVRFDFEGIPQGANLEVHLERALTAKGQPVAVDPIIVVRQ